jgi:hypothetical protein
MIGSDYALKSTSTNFRQKPLSDLSGIVRPVGISDSETMAASNNAFASALQKSAGRDLYRGQGAYADRAGFSRNKAQAMMAGNQEAAGYAQGAKDAASIQADDQLFNSNLNFQYEQTIQNRLLSNQADAIARKGLTWQKMFNRRRNRQQLGMRQGSNRQSVMQNLARSLLSE